MSRTVEELGRAITETNGDTMRAQDGKNLGILTIEDGGLAHVRLTLAERRLERALREIVYAMEGKSKSKNLRNVAAGVTHPARMFVRMVKEAKRARRDAVNYPLCKRALREMDLYVDALFVMRTRATSAQLRDIDALLRKEGVNAINPSITTTGDHPRVA